MPSTPTATYVNRMIRGIPYAKMKSRGDIDAPARWSEAIREQTADLPSIEEACVMKITFLLPPNKFPADYPYGPDLDNLLKRMLDALNSTIFSKAKGRDSCVVSLMVMKTRVNTDEHAGAHIEIFPIALSPMS